MYYVWRELCMMLASVSQCLFFPFHHPVGTFDELKATRYCIDLEKTTIYSQQQLEGDE